MDLTDGAPRAWFKNFWCYTIWFVIWGALFSSLQFVTKDQMAATSFWAVKVRQALFGAIFGVICAVAFTLPQNGLNHARRKWVSWVLAIGTWFTIKVAFAFAMGRLS